MKEHLTEKELIEYQFKLASDTQMEDIAGHLEGCAQCREHLEQLKRKFAALDLLREDVKVSEELISQVISQADKPAQPKVVSFLRPRWLGAAAAVIVGGLILLFAHFTEQISKY